MRAANEEEATTRSSLNRKQASAYQGAFEAVLAVPIAVGFGYWAGGHLGSSTTGVIVGAVIGFASMVLRLTRMRPEPAETSETGDTNEPERGETEAAAKSDAPRRHPSDGGDDGGDKDAGEKDGPMIGFGLFGDDDDDRD